jgi:hypothetical protein
MTAAVPTSSGRPHLSGERLQKLGLAGTTASVRANAAAID